MYGEWMDGIPILVDGCYEHNIEELETAKTYYIKHKNYKEVKNYDKLILEQKILRDKTKNNKNKLNKIINIIFS